MSKALMTALEDQARALGLATCTLESSKTALQSYRNLGYAECDGSDPLPLHGALAAVLVKRL